MDETGIKKSNRTLSTTDLLVSQLTFLTHLFSQKICTL